VRQPPVIRPFQLTFTPSLHRSASHFTQLQWKSCSDKSITTHKGGDDGMAAQTQVTFRNESIPTVDTEPKRIRTVVVDDSPTFLEVTCELLELDPLIDVVARAGKGGEAIETVLKLQPELVLMDVNMPYLDGLTLAWFFNRRFPLARVVLMSTDNTPELLEACEDAGAFDFVHKENFRQEFGLVIQRLCNYSKAQAAQA
jgi:CheY-like chemotaxis protein